MANPNPVVPIREEPNVAVNATPARIFLQPIAAPSVLGLYGFTLATFVVTVSLIGWYGNAPGALQVVPFAAMFGGLTQFAAGMWSFRARDALATAFHGLWGAFWVAYGLIGVLSATGILAIPGGVPRFGWWFVVLAATTWVLTAGASQENRALSAFLGLVAAGASFMFIAEFAMGGIWGIIGGYFMLASAIVAWAIASVMVMQASGKTVFGRRFRVKPITQPAQVTVGVGEPGVIRGQA